MARSVRLQMSECEKRMSPFHCLSVAEQQRPSSSRKRDKVLRYHQLNYERQARRAEDDVVMIELPVLSCLTAFSAGSYFDGFAAQEKQYDLLLSVVRNGLHRQPDRAT